MTVHFGQIPFGLLHAAIVFGLPFAVGAGAGTLAGRCRVTRRAYHAGCFLAALAVASFLSYAGIYFAMRLWLEDAEPGVDTPGIHEVAAAFAIYGWLFAMIAAMPTLGGYLLGYFRASDRAPAPGDEMIFPAPPPDR